MIKNVIKKIKTNFKKLSKQQKTITIITVIALTFGFIFKLFITWNGNFIFMQDTGRDMVDVREMVVLHKLRLIGPTSGLEGIFDGPFWYYLLAIPFIISNGNPYAEVILMILLWVVGGIFLAKLGSRFGVIPILFLLALWLGSNYVGLATIYSFNPNPVILLTPLLIFLVQKYLEDNRLMFAVSVGLLSGLFFNFEMAYGMFVPLIVLITILIFKRAYLMTRKFWLGVGAFVICLLPQIFFYAKNRLLLQSALNSYKSSSHQETQSYLSAILKRFDHLQDLYSQVSSANLMNWTPLILLFVLGWIYLLIRIAYKKDNSLRRLFVISTLFLVIPFLGGIILPITIMPWHLGGGMAAMIILMGLIIFELNKQSRLFHWAAGIFTIITLIVVIINIDLFNHVFHPEPSADPSTFSNELAVVDFPYQYTKGKNFKVYTYIPSVIDYPYQYLFWWEGLNRYGFSPEDYAYLPNQPEYIKEKDKLDTNHPPISSHLIFLIQEPDPAHPERIEAWKNNFQNLKLIESTKIGPDLVEVRQESSESVQKN